MKDEQQLHKLLTLYLQNNISAEQAAVLTQLVASSDEDMVHVALQRVWEQANNSDEMFSSEERAAMLQLILEQPNKRVVSMFSSRWMYAVAAAVLVAGLFAVYQWVLPDVPPANEATEIAVHNDVAPGSSKATLTLSNGQTISLDSAGNGILAADGADKIVKNGDGIAYAGSDDALIQYNTIQTPKGGEYFVELADGTKVWLNAASRLRFPTHFVGGERRVELSGEAYFEVAHNEKQPFKVNVEGKGEVEVLGTSFEINGYDEEDGIRTTLLDGKVKFKVLAGNQAVAELQPGQQAQLMDDGKFMVAKNVNTYEVMAWKEGQFYFESADLKTILRQFERWYNIEVVYEGQVSNRKYFAVISRKSSLNQVLKALQANDIHYRISGNTLTIKPGS